MRPTNPSQRFVQSDPSSDLAHLVEKVEANGYKTVETTNGVLILNPRNRLVATLSTHGRIIHFVLHFPGMLVPTPPHVIERGSVQYLLERIALVG